MLQTEPIDLSSINFNFDFELGKENEIKKDEVSNFIENNFSEISQLNDDLIVLFSCKEGKTFFSINDKESLIEKKEKQ